MRALKLGVGLTALSLLVSTAALAGWQDVASPYDQQRLGKIDEARAKGLSEAQGGSDMGAIHGALDSAGGSVGSVEGGWRCRTIKLGGMAPSRVYSWFSCRVSSRGGHLFFQKINGSQRTSGYLYPNGNGTYVYLGATNMSTEPLHAYSGSGASVGAGATPDDQIGLLVGIGSGHARIELPYPVQESTFDVIELKR